MPSEMSKADPCRRCAAAVRRALPFALVGLVVGSIGGAVVSASRPRVLAAGLFPFWLGYIVLAGWIGRVTRGPAWIAGPVMVLAHMTWLILADDGSLERAGPPTSTSGVGYGILLLLLIPPSLSGHYGSKMGRRSRRE